MDCGNGEVITCVTFTQLVCNKKTNEIKVSVDQKMRFACKPNVLLSVEHAIKEFRKFESLVQMKSNKVENTGEKKGRSSIVVNVTDAITLQLYTGKIKQKRVQIENNFLCIDELLLAEEVFPLQ